MRSLRDAIRAAWRGLAGDGGAEGSGGGEAGVPGPASEEGALAAPLPTAEGTLDHPPGGYPRGDYRPGRQGERCPRCGGALVRYYTRGESYRAASRRHARYAPARTDISEFALGHQYVCDGCGNHW